MSDSISWPFCSSTSDGCLASLQSESDWKNWICSPASCSIWCSSTSGATPKKRCWSPYPSIPGQEPTNRCAARNKRTRRLRLLALFWSPYFSSKTVWTWASPQTIWISYPTLRLWCLPISPSAAPQGTRWLQRGLPQPRQYSVTASSCQAVYR